MVHLESRHFPSKITSTIVLIFLSLACFLVFSPSLKLPFSLIDDGESFRVSKLITDSLTSHQWSDLSDTLIEKDFGRIRAGYWLYQWFYTAVFGANPFLQHLGRILIAILFVSIIYLIGLIISHRLIVATIGSLLFAFFFPSMDNFVRLGPAEVPQLLFLLPAILAITRRMITNSYFSSVGFFFTIASILIAYTVKENTIIITPFLFVIWLFYRNLTNKRLSNQLRILVGLSIILTIAVILASLLIRNDSGNYSSWYRFDISTINYSISKFLYIFRQSFGVLLFVVPFSLIRLIYRLLTANLSRLDRFQLGFWVWFFAGLIVQLPWSFPLGRYIITFLPGLALAMAIEIHLLLAQIKPAFLRYSLLLVLMSLFLAKNSVGYLNFLGDYLAREQTNVSAISYLAANTPTNGSVALNLSTELNAIEWFVETRLHFDHFYHRPDINLHRLSDISSPDNLVAAWSEYPYLDDHQLTTYVNQHRGRTVYSVQASSTSVSLSPLRFIKHLLLSGYPSAMQTVIIRPKTYRWNIYQF